MKEPTDGATSARERRTLKASEWPEADRLAWEAACKPSHRLKKGGSASHLAPVSQEDIATPIRSILGLSQDKSGAGPQGPGRYPGHAKEHRGLHWQTLRTG